MAAAVIAHRQAAAFEKDLQSRPMPYLRHHMVWELVFGRRLRVDSFESWMIALTYDEYRGSDSTNSYLPITGC